MAGAAILAILMFSTVLCTVEVPRMLKNKQYRELCTFSVFLMLGTVLVILKSLMAEVPNPSHILEWVYSPFKNVMKSLLK